MSQSIEQELRSLADAKKAAFFPRYFKAGKGEYAEGDSFLGVTVPLQRSVAKRHKDASFQTLEKLLASKWHEHRLTALFILDLQFEKAQDARRSEIVHFYLSHLKGVNNWDLVDSSAPYLLGEYLVKNDRAVLYDFARSNDLWKQRIAIVSTSAFIKRHDFNDTLRLAEILLTHPHDLIHKAVGWMLREVGKKDRNVLMRFLDTHAKKMPRTMLRYALEKFEERERKRYMERG